MDFLISENQLQLILSEGRLSYRDFSQDQLYKIERGGEKAFAKIKVWRDQNTGRDINHWLNQFGLTISVPSREFLVKNLNDVNFALSGLPLSEIKKEKLREVRDFIEFQLDKGSKFIYLFHEILPDGTLEWSFVNMFDNNRKLWIRLMNQRYPNVNKDNLDKLIEEYFSDGSAEHDLLRAMIYDRKTIFDEIFSDTWGGGTAVENEFFDLVRQNVPEDRIHVFSGKGNFVDRAGIDAGIKCGDSWVPVQVKSSQAEAFSSIPSKGISVFPTPEGFHYFRNKNEPSKPFLNSLFTKCA